MKLEKDPAILDLMKRLDLESKNWSVVDHWEADLCAIGFESPLYPGKLVYVSTFALKEGLYDYSCERTLGAEPFAPSNFEVVKEGAKVTFHELEAVMMNHLGARVLPRKVEVQDNMVTSIYDDHYFTKKSGNQELFREIQTDGPMLIIRSGVVGCKASDILEKTRLLSGDSELIQTWKTQVEKWKNDGFLLCKKKKAAVFEAPILKDPGDTLPEIIAAIEEKLNSIQGKNFAAPPPFQVLQKQFDDIGLQMPIFLKELYSWHGGCRAFLPDDINWDDLSLEYAGSDWLTIDEAIEERNCFLKIWAKKEKPFVFLDSWLPIFGGDGDGYAVDLSTDLTDPLLIEISHEEGARQTKLSLTDALRRVYFAIGNNAWIPDNSEHVET